MDLLDRAKELINQGNTSQQTNSQMAYLQTLTQQASPQTKTEIKAAKDNQVLLKNSINNNAFFLIGGLILLTASVLAIGYWLGKRKSQPKLA